MKKKQKQSSEFFHKIPYLKIILILLLLVSIVGNILFYGWTQQLMTDKENLEFMIDYDKNKSK